MATAVEPSSPGDPITPNTPRENDLPLPPAPRHDGPSEDTGSASWEGVQHVLASDVSDDRQYLGVSVDEPLRSESPHC